MTDETLYAGKFKTVEDLEQGYKNAATVYEENQKLKQQLEGIKAIPDNYSTPSDLGLPDEHVDALKGIAKNTGMNQEQYERFVRESKERQELSKTKFDSAKKELGDENLNILKDYVNKQYPAKIADTVLNQLIVDKEARAAALTHRQMLLNSSIPGANRVAGGSGHYVSRDDMLKAREALAKKPHDLKLREAYINITNQYTEQQKSAG